ncbi:MAG: hypothetical protein LUC98_12180, partial [Lachnospiraceae bacterium]|nr:hypothetical protein [Lachnospiraceae bacterium]
LDETTGSDYDIIPGTEQEKDPTITATYTLDSYVYVEVTDETEGLVEWYIANGWSELDDYENVYAMELRTIYDAETWTLVEDEESAYNGQYTCTDDNGAVYYYNADKGEYTAIIPVLKDNKVTYSADITNDDMTVGETVDLTFQAYIMQMSGFDSAEDAYYELVVTRLTAASYSDLKKIMDYEHSEFTVTKLSQSGGGLTLYAKNGGTAIIDFNEYGLSATTSYLVWTDGTLTLRGNEEDLQGSLGTIGTKQSGIYLVTAKGENAVVKIESGKYYSEASTCRLVRATNNGTVEISGGTYVSHGSKGTLFVADNGTITIDALTGVDLKISGSYTQTLFQAKNGGTIYVAKDVYEELEQAYGEEANVTIVSSDSSCEYDSATGYYVISAN